jgi:glycine cleavage system regulatory protein
VLTVLGDDKPGLVGELSTVIGRHAGNWLESSMAQLGGKFAGIVRVEVAADHAAALQTELEALPGLKITCDRATAATAQAAGERSRRFKLSLVGHDRPGIVREVSSVLARHAVNVERLDTHVASAPMSADPLFHAEADLAAESGLDTAALTTELERISNDLMVDIHLDESLRKK